MSNLIDTLEPRRLFAVSFAAPVATGGTKDPFGIASADFNGDGKADIALAGETGTSADTVAVYLGIGDGTFGAATFLPAGAGAYDLKAGDFNGDGKADLVVSQPLAGSIGLFLGNGDGTFQNRTDVVYATEIPNFSIAFLDTGDFNGDGQLDVVVDNVLSIGPDAVALSVLINNGNGAFTLQPIISIAGNGDVVAGDFNNDGKDDLAYTIGTSSTDAKLFIRTSLDPNATAQTFDLPAASNRLLVGDFNGDGKDDIASATSNSIVASNQKVSVFINGDMANRKDTVATTPFTLASADFDADGKADIVNFPYLQTAAELLQGLGTGAFNAPVAVQLGNGPADFSTVGDFNGDGKIDVAYSQSNPDLALTGGFGVLLNNSTAGVEPGSNPTSSAFTATLTGTAPTSVIAGAKAKKFKQTVTLTNAQQTNLVGPVTVKYVLSKDGIVSDDDVTLLTVNKKKATIKPGKTLKVAGALAIPAAATGGTYQVLALATTSAGSNVAANAGLITVGPATINLGGTFSKLPVTVISTKKNSVTLSITNTGNTAAKGLLNVNLFASTDNVLSSEDPALPTTAKKVTVNPGKTVKVTLKFGPGTFPTGSNFVIATLDPSNTFADIDVSNNTFASGSPIMFG